MLICHTHNIYIKEDQYLNLNKVNNEFLNLIALFSTIK